MSEIEALEFLKQLDVFSSVFRLRHINNSFSRVVGWEYGPLPFGPKEID